MSRGRGAGVMLGDMAFLKLNLDIHHHPSLHWFFQWEILLEHRRMCRPSSPFSPDHHKPQNMSQHHGFRFIRDQQKPKTW